MIEPEKLYATNEIVCPFCGHTHTDSYEHDSDPMQCESCDLYFTWDKRVEVYYTTRPLGKCLVCDRLVPIRWRGEVGNDPEHWRCEPHTVPGADCQCNGSKKGFVSQEEPS